MNEALFFIEVIIIFSLTVIAQKLFGKEGLYVWMAIASILANIEVAKSVEVFGLSATLGNVMFASNFLATDILTELYGPKEARKGVFIGLFATMSYLIGIQLALQFVPNEIDTVQSAMEVVFSLSARICISSVSMCFIANLLDVLLFEKIKEKCNDKKLWLRNNVATITCNCLENFGFVFFAFFGVYGTRELLEIVLSTCLIEIMTSLCDTPFIYLATKLKATKK